MNFSAAKQAIPAYKKVFYGFGGIFSAAECAFVLLFLPFTATLGMSKIVLAVVSVLGIGAPVLLMPFFYALINGATVISTGRYHLPLVLSALGAALSCALLFSLGSFQGGTAALLVFLLLFAFSLCIQVYFYSYFSIGARMDDNDKALNLKSFFLAFGALGFGLAYMFLYNGSAASISTLVYCVSTAGVLAAMFVYLGTFGCMPFFIRIEPRTKRTLKQTFLKLFSPMRHNALSLNAGGGMLVSFGLITALLSLDTILGVAGYGVFSLSVKMAFGAFVVVTTLFAPLLYRLLLRRPAVSATRAAILSSSLILAAFVVLLLSGFLPFPAFARIVVLFVAAALGGIGLGLAFAAEPRLRATFTLITNCTKGNSYCLRNALLMLSAAAAIAMAILVKGIAAFFGNLPAAICAISVTTVALAAGCVLWRLAFMPYFDRLKVKKPLAVPPAFAEDKNAEDKNAEDKKDV